MKAKRVFTQTFGCAAAIIEKEGKFLLVKEANKGVDTGKWNHPGGWIEVGENPIETVIKEVEEETGYKFTPTGVLGVYSLVRENFARLGEEVRHPIKIIFTGTISQERKEDLADDVSETGWFTAEEIERMDDKTLRDLDIKKIIKDYLAGKIYPLELVKHTVSK
jgi:ADP-ribose pyrophosphatase YjhB (NUDIX family)